MVTVVQYNLAHGWSRTDFNIFVSQVVVWTSMEILSNDSGITVGKSKKAGLDYFSYVRVEVTDG